jgi:hypothetical protein
LHGGLDAFSTRYHLKEFGGRNNPTNARELYNLRHSSLRTTVERAFAGYKNCFHILDNKPFHPYKTQVKLVLACCILHNWILDHGVDEVIPLESTWQLNNSEGHEVALDDNLHGLPLEITWLMICGLIGAIHTFKLYSKLFVML